LKLKTFAEHRIRGAILDCLRQLDPLSRSVRQFVRQREEASARLSNSSSVPDAVELASELGISLKQYQRLETAAQAETVLSIDKKTESHRDFAAPRDQTIEHRLICGHVEVEIKQLPDSERSILFDLKSGKTTSEIARSLHLTEAKVSQIKKQAIRQLQSIFRPDRYATERGSPPTSVGSSHTTSNQAGS
jgi:RNA polymerase sigma factor for flagellar operon FliA